MALPLGHLGHAPHQSKKDRLHVCVDETMMLFYIHMYESCNLPQTSLTHTHARALTSIHTRAHTYASTSVYIYKVLSSHVMFRLVSAMKGR